MSTPFYQPNNGADNEGTNPDPQAGNYPAQPWDQAPAPQPFYGGQAQTPNPQAPSPWGAAPGFQNDNIQPTYNAPQNYPAAMPQYGQYGQYQPQPQQKSMILAAVLAFFLGGMGIHNFYLGYTRVGLVQLGLTVAGWVLSIVLIGFVFLFVVGVWAFIDFLMILTRSGRFKVDSRGVPLL